MAAKSQPMLTPSQRLTAHSLTQVGGLFRQAAILDDAPVRAMDSNRDPLRCRAAEIRRDLFQPIIGITTVVPARDYEKGRAEIAVAGGFDHGRQIIPHAP